MKKCFKCGQEKSINEFYKHSQMSDGHLNKCAECTKTDSKKWRKNIETDPVKKAKDLEYHRKYVKGKRSWKPSKEIANEYAKRYRDNYPEKYKARMRCTKLKPIIKGNDLHHWSYNIDDSTSVIELSIIDHRKLHRFLIYDQEFFMYRRIDTMELLDTLEKHTEYSQHIISTKD